MKKSKKKKCDCEEMQQRISALTEQVARLNILVEALNRELEACESSQRGYLQTFVDPLSL